MGKGQCNGGAVPSVVAERMASPSLSVSIRARLPSGFCTSAVEGKHGFDGMKGTGVGPALPPAQQVVPREEASKPHRATGEPALTKSQVCAVHKPPAAVHAACVFLLLRAPGT